MSEVGHTPEIPEPPRPELNDEALQHLGLLARVRVGHAERVIEKMDHKDALYIGLGAVATRESEGIPSPNVNARPQSRPEQFLDWRMRRRSDKAVREKVYAYRAEKIFGPDHADPIPSVRQGLTESALGAVTDREPSHKFSEVAVENTKRLFDGPKIPGYTGLKRLIEKGRVALGCASFNLTAAEARGRWREIKATDPKFGNKMHKTTRRHRRSRAERMEMAAEQPVLSRWRDMRRRRAEAVLERYRPEDHPENHPHED